MKWLIRYSIYALAAYALYRLWPARGFVWWCLLASAMTILSSLAPWGLVEGLARLPRAQYLVAAHQPHMHYTPPK